MATAATTPTTTPAIAPPDSEGLDEPLLTLPTETADSVGVVVADADVEDTDEDEDEDSDVDVDVDVVADVDVDVKASVEVWCLASISRSSRTSKAAKASLAFFLHALHEYPALESHLVSRYIDTHRSDPSGSQLKSFCLPMGESVQFCASSPRAISVAPVALVYRKVHALTSGTSNSTYSGSIMATWVF